MKTLLLSLMLLSSTALMVQNVQQVKYWVIDQDGDYGYANRK